MKEYYGGSAKIYKQTKGKRFLLIPSILRSIKETKKHKLLDLACGNGDFSEIFSKKGYKYTGIDISKDMVTRAQHDYPKSKFIVAAAKNFSKKVENKFDIVLISMLFPSISKFQDIVKILEPISHKTL